jgi:hypothetical protein
MDDIYLNLEEEFQKQKIKISELIIDNQILMYKIKNIEENVFLYIKEEIDNFKKENENLKNQVKELKENVKEYKFKYNDSRCEEIINFFNNISLSIYETSYKYEMTIEETMEFIKEHVGLYGSEGLYSAIDYHKCYFEIHGIYDENWEEPYSDSDSDSDSVIVDINDLD